MLVVGFDTATPAVSVALHDGERVVSEASAADGRRHGELLTPMIAQVLSDAGASRADLTAVARPSTPEELAAMFDHEDKTAVPLIKKLGIKSE